MTDVTKTGQSSTGTMLTDVTKPDQSRKIRGLRADIMLPTYHGYVQPMASEIAHGNIYKTRKKTRRKEKVMIV